tara:strand:- start:694 stop:1059 length:366 start_codon:yes stop_codon:yes gene_type:complete
MALVNTVEKRIKMQKDGVIKYQIITFCFLNDLQLSKSDLECLLELAKKGSINVTNFCKHISELNIFKSPQSCRNAVQKAKKKDLIIMDGKNIILNPDMKIQVEGQILLDFKILGTTDEIGR